MGDGAWTVEGLRKKLGHIMAQKPYTAALIFTSPWSHTGKKLKLAWGTKIFFGFVLTPSPMHCHNQSNYISHLT